ncbi:MAG: Ribonuclease HI [Alphaproteobacteria bacterium MarineAlpha9_Bin3]|nr:MAG: Ribonuclease HI [Alphaproteobacteria bacterium MarineAlpha9_Bin3]|tara:strand:- start:7672 stop:8112 length:441 start_codon:yes stop_codon:yes gene_type:complete
MNKTTIINIWTDGACSGNPGPGGWGVLIKFNNSEKKLSGSEKNTTNNRMEMLAVINALKFVEIQSSINLFTDSKYVKDGITKWIHGWKKNNWRNSQKKEVKNKDLWIELDTLSQKHRINWIWVKGHSGNIENDIADELATQAIETI